MGVFDFLKKKKGENNSTDIEQNTQGVQDEPREVDYEEEIEKKPKTKTKYNEALSDVDKSKLSFKEKMGMKMFQRMSQKKQEDVLRKAMNPQQVMKHKDKIEKQIEGMISSGQIDKGQAEAVRSKLGLR